MKTKLTRITTIITTALLILQCCLPVRAAGADNLRPVRAVEYGPTAPDAERLKEEAGSLGQRLRGLFSRIDALEGLGYDERRREEDKLVEVLYDAVLVPEPVSVEDAVRANEQTPPAPKLDLRKRLSESGPRHVLVVGANGYIGRSHLAMLRSAFEQLEGEFHLLGGIDLQSMNERTKQLFERYNPGVEPNFFTSVDDLKRHIAERNIPLNNIIAIIATQNPLHLGILKEYAGLGIEEFIMEKVFADTPEETREIIDFAKEESLSLVGAGQLFTSELADNIKDIIRTYSLKPELCFLSFSKDRRQRSLEDKQNVENPHIFTFELFHELGVAALFGCDNPRDMLDVEIEYAFTRPMDESGYETLPDHGVGVAAARHKNGMRSLCYTNFLRPGKDPAGPNQKTVNIVCKDGSVIAAYFSTSDNHAQRVICISPEGVIKQDRPIVETERTMLARAQACFIYDAVTGRGQFPTAEPSYHMRMAELMDEAVELARRIGMPEGRPAGEARPAGGEFIGSLEAYRRSIGLNGMELDKLDALRKLLVAAAHRWNYDTRGRDRNENRRNARDITAQWVKVRNGLAELSKGGPGENLRQLVSPINLYPQSKYWVRFWKQYRRPEDMAAYLKDTLDEILPESSEFSSDEASLPANLPSKTQRAKEKALAQAGRRRICFEAIDEAFGRPALISAAGNFPGVDSQRAIVVCP